MDLKQIESFVRVAELGSFTRAATALGTPQPVLSRQVRQLEVELHQTLFARTGRGVTLTEAGALLLAHGRGILHQVNLAREELGRVRNALSGQVSIGLPPSLARLLTVPLTLALRAELPEATLTLTEGFSVSSLEGLRAGRLDMAVLYNPAAAPDLETSLLQRESLVLIGAQAQVAQARLRKRLPLAELAHLPLILPSRPNAFRLLVDAELQKIALKPHVVIEIDGLNAILELVREGLGYAVLPGYTLGSVAQPEAYVTVRSGSPRLDCELMLARSARRAHTATQAAAERIVREVIQSALQSHAHFGGKP